MHISSADFFIGAATAAQYPSETLPEVAFVGRSNVGKSSLLNRLLNRKSLARVSQTPGCTRQINFFRVNDRWWFVDLPGYGFARVGRKQKESWQREIDRYMEQRRDVRAVILLLDPRRGITDLDQEMVNMLNNQGLPCLPVATKCDKLGGNARRQALVELNQVLAETARFALLPVVPCSSLNGTGLPELWERLLPLLTDGAL